MAACRGEHIRAACASSRSPKRGGHSSIDVKIAEPRSRR
jgi:hypothetical protein